MGDRPARADDVDRLAPPGDPPPGVRPQTVPMPTTLTRATGTITADFDVLGLARVRLIDAAERDIAAVARQFGLAHEPSAGVADLTIRYVDRRRKEGKSTPEIMRVLKRYVARETFKYLPRHHVA